MSFNYVAIFFIKGNGCKAQFLYVNKDKAVGITNNTDLKETSKCL